MVSAGAKILGSFTVGSNSKIGSGSVVVSEVPPNSTVVGVPGRVVKRDGVKLPQNDLNQTDLPNPNLMDINHLQRENEELRNILTQFMKHVERAERKEKKNEDI